MSIRPRQGWEDRVGVATMQPVLPPRDLRRRVALGTHDGTLRTRDHAVVVYWTRDELLEVVIPYLVEGLNVGDKVVYMADDTPVAAIVSALRRAGIEVERELASGRLALLTAAESFFTADRFDVDDALAQVRRIAQDAAAQGYQRIRLSLEMTYLMAEVPGIEHGPEFEARTDEIFGDFAFVCLCSFNGHRDSGTMLDHVLATHPILICNGIPLYNRHFFTTLKA